MMHAVLDGMSDGKVFALLVIGMGLAFAALIVVIVSLFSTIRAVTSTRAKRQMMERMLEHGLAPHDIDRLLQRLDVIDPEEAAEHARQIAAQYSGKPPKPEPWSA